jgi:hypothetical protein
MRKAEVVAVVLAAAAILAAPCLAVDEVFQQTYPLPAGGSFELQNVNGSVHVSAWEREEVEVYAKKTARQDPSDLKRVEIEVEARANEVSVQTRYPQEGGVEVYVEYHIRVPQRVQLRRVATVNGDVRVFGVDAAGELRSVNGDIEVYDSAGGMSARTTNGNLRLELRQLEASGPVTLETVNGSVLLAVPAGTGAELEVRSLNGDFRSELPLTLYSSKGPREFRARLGASGTPLRIRTVNGGIRVVALRPGV